MHYKLTYLTSKGTLLKVIVPLGNTHICRRTLAIRTLIYKRSLKVNEIQHANRLLENWLKTTESNHEPH